MARDILEVGLLLACRFCLDFLEPASSTQNYNLRYKQNAHKDTFCCSLQSCKSRTKERERATATAAHSAHCVFKQLMTMMMMGAPVLLLVVCVLLEVVVVVVLLPFACVCVCVYSFVLLGLASASVSGEQRFGGAQKSTSDLILGDATTATRCDAMDNNENARLLLLLLRVKNLDVVSKETTTQQQLF